MISTDGQPKRVGNGIVWMQAFVPVIGAFFAFGTIVVIIINIILLSIDARRLEKAGYDTSGVGTVWLVPVYLYQRAKLLNDGMGYFIVWCVTFGLGLFGFF